MVASPEMASPTEVYTGEREMASRRLISRTLDWLQQQIVTSFTAC